MGNRFSMSERESCIFAARKDRRQKVDLLIWFDYG